MQRELSATGALQVGLTRVKYVVAHYLLTDQIGCISPAQKRAMNRVHIFIAAMLTSEKQCKILKIKTNKLKNLRLDQIEIKYKIIYTRLPTKVF